MTQIILRNENGQYSVAVDQVEMDLDRIWDLVIRPILLAAGYDQEAVDKYEYRPESVDTRR